ncbi:MAG TPA: hypothetical protein VEQ61_01400, partial [Thermoleophilaceae bacterium]|nr:hypothetical protein [Thermoleophilaceae bacterium]
MARRSLKPQLNQIRTWVRQGRTDAWIAHQLDVSVPDIRHFKSEHGLAPAEADEATGESAAPAPEDIDLRAEDDALVAAALEAEQQAEAEEPDEAAEVDAEGDGDSARKPRRRGRRGGRGRRSGRSGKPLEGTFDHGDEGYGLWLDPAVQDDPVYAEHWAGHRPVVVTVEQDQIVIKRAGEEEASADGEGEGEAEEPAPESSLDPDEFDAERVAWARLALLGHAP